MRILGIIPARFASTRFPGKPLADIAGKSMIQRVYEQCRKSKFLDQVIVATDDPRIQEHVLTFNGQVCMTSPGHQSGTDRCAEVAEQHSMYDIYINIQGDEPFIDPNQIDSLCACFKDSKNQIATLVKQINQSQELSNPNSPKVVLGAQQQAIYFSRAAIPFFRGEPIENWLQKHTYYKHIGIYGYRKEVLANITKLAVSGLEKAEGLEQLRWIENGYRIQTALTNTESWAIDTPEDLQNLLKHKVN